MAASVQPPSPGPTGVPVWVQLVITFLTAGGLGAAGQWANGKAQGHRERDRDAASQNTLDFTAVNEAARKTLADIRDEASRLRDLLRQADRRIDEVDQLHRNEIATREAQHREELRRRDVEHQNEVQAREASFARLMGEYRELLAAHDECARNLIRAMGVLQRHNIPFPDVQP